MNAQLMTRTLVALALAGAILGIAWAQDKPPAVPGQKAPAKPEAKEEDEAAEAQEMKLADAPKPVQAAINKLTGGKSAKISKESDEGVTIYEVAYEVDGQKHSADISAAGDVIALEAVVKADSLPKAVTDAIAKAHPKSTIKQAESVQEFFYEIVVTVDGKNHALKVSPAGEIEGAEAKDEKDKD